MSRDLSTKGLAGRLSAEYSVRRPFRRRLFLVTGFCLLALGGLWAAVTQTGPRDAMYTPGTVAAVHRTVAKDCATCHDMFRSTPESKCQVCHTTPGHNAHAAKTLKLDAPACYECHLEHRGGLRAPPAPDARCIQCHHDLQKNSKEEVMFTPKIDRFGVDHPEFAVLKQQEKDPTQLNFNHRFHLDKKARAAAIGSVGEQWPRLVAQVRKAQGAEDDPGLKDPAVRDELTCTDCHFPDASGRLMQPVRYAKHCASCHALDYDLEQRATGASQIDRLPHATPAEIRRHLVAQFTRQRERITAAEPGSKKLPTPTAMKQAAEWVRSRVTDVERGLIATGRCAQCHMVKVEEGGAGTAADIQAFSVTPTAIPEKWFPHARFSHIAHRTVACESCHDGVRLSADTQKVNLPSIRACASCHTVSGGARSDCAECHLYHDEKDRLRQQGKIRNLPDGAGR